VETLGSLKGDFVLDGELVALDPQGRPSFRLSQGATTTSIPIYFYAFDVLNENAQLLLDQPLSQRRAVLESLLAGAPEALRVSPLLRAAIGTDPRGAA
jgi:bifunctional non-homologous end joining protein LigD